MSKEKKQIDRLGSGSFESSADSDLPPELKSIEAELAGLTPRADRLDRERVIFLAGRESVENRSTAAARRFAWPMAFSVMTTVAAVLAVMLAVRSDPESIVKIVRVPVEVPVVDPVPQPDVPEVRVSEPPVESTPDRQWVASERPKWLTWIGASWPRRGDRIADGERALYPAMRDRVLAGKFDSYSSGERNGKIEPYTAPVPYRQLLEQALEDTTFGRRS